jgi:hypothetical protein
VAKVINERLVVGGETQMVSLRMDGTVPTTRSMDCDVSCENVVSTGMYCTSTIFGELRLKVPCPVTVLEQSVTSQVCHDETFHDSFVLAAKLFVGWLGGVPVWRSALRQTMLHS